MDEAARVIISFMRCYGRDISSAIAKITDPFYINKRRRLGELISIQIIGRCLEFLHIS